MRDERGEQRQYCTSRVIMHYSYLRLSTYEANFFNVFGEFLILGNGEIKSANDVMIEGDGIRRGSNK